MLCATRHHTKSNLEISRAQDSLPVTRTRSPYLQLRLGEATVIIIKVIQTVFSFSRSSSSSSESFKLPNSSPPTPGPGHRATIARCAFVGTRAVSAGSGRSPGARGGCRPRPFATLGYADLLDLRCALARDNTIKGLDMVLRKLGGHTPQTVTQLTARHLIWALST